MSVNKLQVIFLALLMYPVTLLAQCNNLVIKHDIGEVFIWGHDCASDPHFYLTNGDIPPGQYKIINMYPTPNSYCIVLSYTYPNGRHLILKGGYCPEPENGWMYDMRYIYLFNSLDFYFCMDDIFGIYKTVWVGENVIVEDGNE